MQTSCNVDGPTESQIQTAIIDAEAASVAFLETEWMIATGPIGAVACVAIVGAAGAVGSDLGSGQNRTSGTGNPNGDLPQYLLLTNNPFEEVGIEHNKNLNLFVQENGVMEFSQKLVNYDSIAITKLFQQSQQSELQTVGGRNEVRTFLQSNNFSSQISNAGNHLRSAETTDQLIDLIPIAAKEKLEIKAIVSEYEQLKSDNKTSAEIAVYLNGKCKTLLNKEVLTRDENAQLVFITVLKHSNHYWTNN